MFLVSASNRPRKRKRTNRETAEEIGGIGKVPKKDEKRTTRDKKGRISPDREAPCLKPRLPALENFEISEPQNIGFPVAFRDFPANLVSAIYFSDSGSWPFHTPPIYLTKAGAGQLKDSHEFDCEI